MLRRLLLLPSIAMILMIQPASRAIAASSSSPCVYRIIMPLIISTSASAASSHVASAASTAIASSARCSLPNVDFNGDGYADLAVGVPYEDVGDISNAGIVQVFYGTASGLAAGGNQIWSQDSPGVEDSAEVGDGFAYQLATGDFNGDGKTDLAIGDPYEDIVTPSFTRNNAGVVHILYGSSAGLTASGSQLWSQGSAGVEGEIEAEDNFGYGLSTGDFNGDGRAELVIGTPSEDLTLPTGGTLTNAGVVQVLYGSTSGLTATGSQLWSQDSPGVEGLAETEDSFGSALGTGDFNGDGRADLVIGSPSEDVATPGGDQADAGVVQILYGSTSGLTAAGNQIWSQDNSSIEGDVESSDQFGFSLAIGYFNGDGNADLAVGVPGDNGAQILYGSTMGLTADGNQLWSQDSPGIEGAFFGDRLVAGDFNGDGRSDLAIGAPAEDVLTPAGSAADGGAVNILYGSAPGLAPSGSQRWTQDSPGIEGVVEAFDEFGYSLAAGDFNGDGKSDLAIGAQSEDVLTPAGDLFDAGAVNVLYGSAGGLAASGNQLWTQDSPGVEGAVETMDLFGRVLN